MGKKVAKSELIEHVAFKLDAGQEPALDRAGAHGGHALRDWQDKGFKELTGHKLRMLISPTASGKSTLIKALAADELSKDRRLRVLVAMPQSLIARSFADDVLELEDDTLLEWLVAPGNDITAATAHTVARLIAFLKAPPASHAAGRVLLCTHQTLVMAHKRLMKERKGKASPWARVSLFVDEAHHSKSDEGEDAKKANNRLGELVEHWLDEEPGPLLLATATMMRGDLLDIVPSGRVDAFTKYVRSMEEHLRSMRYLKEVSFRFLIGRPEDALAALYREGNKKTIAWLPAVTSRHIRGAGTNKLETLGRYQDAIGKVVRTDEWTSYLRTNGKPSRTVRALDFVDPDGRDERKAKLEEAIPLGPKRTPDLLWALGLGKEGFDWPEIERAVIIGDRGSLTDINQMQGRVLRDHPGKTTAEVNVILPWESEGEPNPEAVKGYIQTIIASMVIEWQLTQKRSRRAKPVESVIDDPTKAVKALRAVVDAAISDPQADKHSRKIIQEALKSAGAKSDDDAVKELHQRLSLLSAGARAIATQSKDLPAVVEVAESVFDGIRTLAVKFGYKSLAAYREALGVRGEWAPIEEVRRRIQGMSKVEYNVTRKEWGQQYPEASYFPRIYGMTYGELQTGIRPKNPRPRETPRPTKCSVCQKPISGGGKSSRCISCALRARYAGMTPEQRFNAVRSAVVAMTPEKRATATKGRHAGMTPEQRSDAARVRMSAMTPEQRSAAALKTWETRRAKMAGEAVE